MPCWKQKYVIRTGKRRGATLSMRRRLVIATASPASTTTPSCCGVPAMMWSFLGWGKGIIPQGAIRPERATRRKGEKGREEVRGFRSGGIYIVADGGGNGGAQDA